MPPRLVVTNTQLSGRSRSSTSSYVRLLSLLVFFPIYAFIYLIHDVVFIYSNTLLMRCVVAQNHGNSQWGTSVRLADFSAATVAQAAPGGPAHNAYQQQTHRSSFPQPRPGGMRYTGQVQVPMQYVYNRPPAPRPIV